MAKQIRPDIHGTNPRTIAFPDQAVSITAESDALAVATTANWLNVSGWRTDLTDQQRWSDGPQRFESFHQLEIDIVADAAETITGAALYSIRLAPVVISDDTFTSSGSDNINTATSHGMLTGDGPFRLSSSTTLPDPFSSTVDYYAEYLSSSTFALHLTRAGAIAGDAGVVTTDTGTGTHTIADKQSNANSDDDTRRCRFALVGRLNSGAATVGTIVVGAQTSYVERIDHSPLDLYYVVLATETSATTLTITVTPIMEVIE